jgi:CrcB protein
MIKLLTIFIGGGLGSLARYSISVLILNTRFIHFPLATLLSNMIACLILALCVTVFKEKIDASSWMAPLLITGFCGGFSTFSTFSYETVLLAQQGQLLWAALNVGVSLALCLGIFWLFLLKP